MAFLKPKTNEEEGLVPSWSDATDHGGLRQNGKLLSFSSLQPSTGNDVIVNSLNRIVATCLAFELAADFLRFSDEDEFACATDLNSDRLRRIRVCRRQHLCNNFLRSSEVFDYMKPFTRFLVHGHPQHVKMYKTGSFPGRSLWLPPL